MRKTRKLRTSDVDGPLNYILASFELRMAASIPWNSVILCWKEEKGRVIKSGKPI